jgi:phage shock protein E
MRLLLLGTLLPLLLACEPAPPSIHPSALTAMAAGALVIDVRTPEEFSLGHYSGAINIPHEQILAGVQSLGIDAQVEMVLYCRSGNRSGQAQRALEAAGFQHTINAGGLEGLLSATNTLAVIENTSP